MTRRKRIEVLTIEQQNAKSRHEKQLSQIGIDEQPMNRVRPATEVSVYHL